jgi:hypothetical protein
MPNLPKDVERYVQEGLKAGMAEDKAWAIAWSRWCKYKRPGDEHCKKGPEGYFTGKTAMVHVPHVVITSFQELARDMLDQNQGSAFQISFGWPLNLRTLDRLAVLLAEPDVLAKMDVMRDLLSEDAPELAGRVQSIATMLERAHAIRKSASGSEFWGLVSPDGYLFGVADMPNAKSKSYWRVSVDDDHLDEAALVKLVNLPLHLKDRVQKNDFDDGYAAWAAVRRFAVDAGKHLASKTVTTIKGKLPPPRDPAAREMALNPPSGGGKHKNKQDYERGRARKPKHPNQVEKEAHSLLSLRRDYGSLDAAWGNTIYDA